jgi:hypothetical protein
VKVGVLIPILISDILAISEMAETRGPPLQYRSHIFESYQTFGLLQMCPMILHKTP